MALARKPFVVIDAEILSSSIWSESATTKLVWLTLLILCDTDGYVGAAVPGIARAAGVSLEECERSLEVLQAPDPHSRTQANEGRRVQVVERGFQVLNFKLHLDRMSAERAKSRERVRRHRANRRERRNVSSALHGAPVTPGNVTVTPGSRDQGPGTSDKGLTSTEPTPPGVALVVHASDWNREAADDFRSVYGGDPPKQFFAQVKPVAKRFGWARTRPALLAYMSETPIEYLNVAKCLAVKVENGARAPARSAKAQRGLDGMKALIEGGLKGDGT